MRDGLIEKACAIATKAIGGFDSIEVPLGRRRKTGGPKPMKQNYTDAIALLILARAKALNGPGTVGQLSYRI